MCSASECVQSVYMYYSVPRICMPDWNSRQEREAQVCDKRTSFADAETIEFFQ